MLFCPTKIYSDLFILGAFMTANSIDVNPLQKKTLERSQMNFVVNEHLSARATHVLREIDLDFYKKICFQNTEF